MQQGSADEPNDEHRYANMLDEAEELSTKWVLVIIDDLIVAFSRGSMAVWTKIARHVRNSDGPNIASWTTFRPHYSTVSHSIVPFSAR